MRMLSPASSSNGAVREKIVPQNGTPLTVALEFATGKRVKSPRGGPDEIYYSLTGNRAIYLPLTVAEEIEKLNLAAREPFMLCKYGPGDWEVARPPERRGAPVSEGTSAARTANNSQASHTESSAPVNGAGETAAQILAGCYAAGLGVVVDVIADAKASGLHLAPTFEDLRCVAATLFIARTGGRQ